MATSAPEQEEEKKALFGPDYDERKSLFNPDPKDNKPAGDSSDPRVNTPSLTPSSISDKEKSVSNDSSDSSADLAEKSGLYSGAEKGGRFTKWQGRLVGNVKRRATVGIIAGVLGVGGIAGFGIIQGPLKLVHFSQLLQRHFTSNESFGDSRMGRVMYHLALGDGIQRSRLGIAGNKVADKIETRMANDTGIRPVYDKSTGRLRGFQVVDGFKANELTGNGGRDVNKNFGEGAEIKNTTDRDGLVLKDGTSARGQMIMIDNTNFGDRRKALKTIVKSTSLNSVASSMSVRLLKKRAGISLHWMNKAKQNADERTMTRREKKEERKKEVGEQVKNGSVEASGVTAGADSEGNTSSADEAVDGESKDLVRDFMSKGVVKTGASAAAVVGVLCMAKQFGNNVDTYKYENNFLPMMRTGAMFISAGDQTRAMDDFDMESLETMSDFLDQNGEHFYQAESLIAEDGGTGGKQVPKEASLKNVGDRPEFFNAIDNIPGLGTACSVQDGILGLPVIKNVAGAIGGISNWFVNGALSLADTSTEELMTSALKTVAGASVDLNSKSVTGADIGNFANIGSFSMANESIRAQGGTPLTTSETSILNQQLQDDLNINNQERSFYARYLDPYNYDTLTSKAIDKTNPSTIASFLTTPLKNLGSILTPTFSKVNAQTSNGYDYGIPKYGFSLDLQEDERFDDPNKNALLVEQDLDNLNDKYSKCFGTKVITDDSGIRIETETDKDKLNVFKLSDDCKDNNDEMFLRYRFYIADTITTLSASCYEGDEEACSNLTGGTASTAKTTSQNDENSNSADSSTTGPSPTVDGSAQDIAKQILAKNNIDLTNYCRHCKEDIQNTANGSPAYGNINIDINILKFILDLSNVMSVNVNSITGAGSGHSSGSRHYSGTAIDFECDMKDGAKIDQIGAKYGIKSNYERCDAGINHWHYSTSGT